MKLDWIRRVAVSDCKKLSEQIHSRRTSSFTTHT
ncbi:hypothetical protein M6B38_395055 [Iris pallida]|uniref:Uncharacterized protein n=1 Tax=Iris pallida TaxID=29817 RepID=A0AAX6FYA5_IRIPA|nr:hypothetical protein M6B38_395055 [Iris pallida]